MNTIFHRNNRYRVLKDYILLRVLILVGSVLSTIITIMHRKPSPASMSSIHMGLAFTAFFILILVLSFSSSFVKRNAFYFIFVISFVASVSSTYFCWINKFSTEAILIMVLVILATILILKKTSQLILYISCMMTLTIAALLTVEIAYFSKLHNTVFFVVFYLVAFIGIKLRLGVQESLKESEEEYRTFVEISPLAIVIFQDYRIVYANSTAIKLAGASRSDELVGKTINDFICPENMESTFSRLAKVSKGEKVDYVEQRMKKLDGIPFYVEVNVIAVKHHGKPAFMSIIKDISERKKAEEQIRYIAYNDTLTGLPNRYMFNDCLSQLLSHANNMKMSIGIIFIDLDRFKIINDTLGHNFGDLILRNAADRLLKSVRKGDFVSRYGGDEFVIILKDTNIETSSQIAQRIIHEFSNSFHITDHEVFISPSIGISFYPKDGLDTDTLVKNADTAMYLAKERGRNNYQFYTSDLNEAVSRKMELETRLRRALTNNEFVLYYQPQVDLKSGKIAGMEALIRWRHPQLGMISPAEFIPLAEETGLINPIGEWVLETACTQNKAWQEAGFPSIPIAVNVSRCQFQYSNFVDTVNSILEKTKLAPHYLDIEITESVMQEINTTKQFINKLKELEIKISIDDFGTGYSSLNLLKNLTIDCLKIDPTFMKDMAVNPSTEVLIKFIIDMGHHLNFTIVAEGIEDEKQMLMLKQYGCDLYQGYFFSKPLPADEIESLFEKE